VVLVSLEINLASNGYLVGLKKPNLFYCSVFLRTFCRLLVLIVTEWNTIASLYSYITNFMLFMIMGILLSVLQYCVDDDFNLCSLIFVLYRASILLKLVLLNVHYVNFRPLIKIL